MKQKNQRNKNQKLLHIFGSNPVKRFLAIGLLHALLLQGISAVPIGKFSESFHSAVSAQASEILFDRDSVELYDDASGDIVVEPGMLDFIFKPEEDGAWMLDMYAYAKNDLDIACDYQIILYEWQYANQWQRIDYFFGPGTQYLEEDHCCIESVVPQYYQKGHTYRMRFLLMEHGDADPACFHYTFQKTNFAGCYEDWVWRSKSGIWDEGDRVSCVRYLGNETVVQMPDEIGGYPVYALGGENSSMFNENLQVLTVGKNVELIYNLNECKNLKDIYVYNRNCYVWDNVCPQVYDEEALTYYYDTVIHGYAGGELEKGCKERDYPFEALPEPPSPSPEQTASPTPNPILDTPAPFPTTPPPAETTGSASPLPTGISVNPSPTIPSPTEPVSSATPPPTDKLYPLSRTFF